MEGISCACREPQKGIKDHKLYRFKRLRERILSENERGNLRSVNFSDIPTKPGSSVAFDWLIDVMVGISGGRKEIVICQVGIDEGVLAGHAENLTIDTVLRLCTAMAKIIDAKVGFVANMPRAFMPIGYGVGLACVGAGKKLVWDANSWSDGAWRQYATRLRNVHAMNFLSRQHLEQRVGSQNLADWIVSDSKRGLLKAWDNDLFLWSFARADDWPQSLDWDGVELSHTREELERHQFFPWQEFIARFPPGTPGVKG
jgi:hypothetical protein